MRCLIRRRQYRYGTRLRSRCLRIDRSRQRGVHRHLPVRLLNLAPLRDRRAVYLRLHGMIYLGWKRLSRFLSDPVVVRSFRTSVFFFGNRLHTERTVGDDDRYAFVRFSTGKRLIVGIVLIRLRRRFPDRKRVRLTGRMPNEPHVERKPYRPRMQSRHPFGVLRMIHPDKRFRHDGSDVPADVERPFRLLVTGHGLVGRGFDLRIFL